ncbi:FAD-dependent oxidoreductase [Streptomyces hoynatensis]|uniref:FAD-dependent oxidoreductase n=1 Tax=Streptomyces hoynatensis TaxID=1141874 RepID=A0A3A9Z9K1_9ACTN|nr:FAD-dependent oxidoreductase [Streptomyces hoynatensis]RKN43996.1 FAD-dependent oxidoreductase [Streptomyces hoynatensis]
MTETEARRAGETADGTAYDVVVAGSGAAGLTAAVRTARAGLRTLVLEAADEFGGTTALSGGRVWVPVNGTPENAGDSPEAARTYLSQLFDPRWPEFVEAFVAHAPRMREFVEEATPHRFAVCPHYPDYHPHLAGATVGGRCFDMEVLDLGRLVPEAARVREAPGYVPIRHAEWEEWRYPAHFDHERLRARYAAGGRTGGVALAAALVDGAVRAGARLRAGARVVDVLRAGDGVGGVVVRTPSGTEHIRARAVVLATGGFDGNPRLREQLLPAGLGVSAAAPSNTGLALDLADRLGAPTANVHDGWWMPMAQVPGEKLDGRDYPRGLVRERGTPRAVIVNTAGRRFIDEAAPYNEFGKAMHRLDELGRTPNREAYLIFDEGFRSRYPFPGLTPSGPLAGHIVSAGSLAELARRIGVDAEGLQESVARWNAFSAQGRDEEFHRGENPYDRYYGDPWQEGNPNLGPIDRPPYYATRVHSGCIGSKGGLTTDTAGRVLGADGPLPGLYAVGNAAAFWAGDGYPGPGATLAVGMVMGLLAAEDIAGTAGS